MWGIFLEITRLIENNVFNRLCDYDVYVNLNNFLFYYIFYKIEILIN